MNQNPKPQQSRCLFQCMECDKRWKKKLADYAAFPDPRFPELGKGPCPWCGSLYYRWLNLR